jgi:uncharacterized protein YdiU (UPF0061 family)
MREKIGLTDVEDDDLSLIQALLSTMQAGQADFTLTFRRLSHLAADDGAEDAFLTTFSDSAAAKEWLARWRERLTRETTSAAERSVAMLGVNPAFIPRNHRIEQAIAAAVEDADFSLFEALLDVLARPYEDHAEFTAYMQPPRPEERVLQTFCGT